MLVSQMVQKERMAATCWRSPQNLRRLVPHRYQGVLGASSRRWVETSNGLGVRSEGFPSVVEASAVLGFAG